MSVEAPRATPNISNDEVDTRFNALAFTIMDPEAPQNTGNPKRNADSARDMGDFSGFDPEKPENFSFNIRETLAEVMESSTKRVADVLRSNGENGETGKERVKQVGKGALRAAGDLSLISLGVTYLTAEAAKNGVKTTVKKLVISAKQARINFQERRTKRRQEKQARRAQEEQLDSEYVEARARNIYEDRLDKEFAEAQEMNDQYDHDSAQDFHQERLEAEASELRAEADRDAREAEARKAVRNARRQANRDARRRQRRQELREFGNDLQEAYIAPNARRIGRAARFAWRNMKRVGRAFKRGGKAVAAGTRAAKASWDTEK